MVIPAVLLAVLGSVIPLGGAMVAVLVMLPLVDTVRIRVSVTDVFGESVMSAVVVVFEMAMFEQVPDGLHESVTAVLEVGKVSVKGAFWTGAGPLLVTMMV